MNDTSETPSDMLNVRAASGLRLPMEGRPGQYIEGDAAVSVPNSHYYRKALQCGDITLAEDSAAPAATATSTDTPADAAPKTVAKKGA